jgi:hypothetical protein
MFDATPIDAYFHENCDYEQVDVTAKDYEFEGIRDELPAGTASLRFTNEGADAHEIAVFRRNAGTTETIEELLALPDEQIEQKVMFVTAAVADPGETDYVLGELEPGDYVAVCFIAQGTTTLDCEGTGPPHAVLGMVEEFTVASSFAGGELLDQPVRVVVVVLHRRRLHEVRGRAEQWAADAAVERKLAAAHRVDDHAGRVG